MGVAPIFNQQSTFPSSPANLCSQLAPGPSARDQDERLVKSLRHMSDGQWYLPTRPMRIRKEG